MKPLVFTLSAIALTVSSTMFSPLAAATAMHATQVAEQQAPTVPEWPQARYQNTPTVEDVLGYPAGARISSPAQISEYFQALAEAHPDQIKLFEYGETWQGRPLFYAAIGSAENIAKLNDIEWAR